MRTLSRLAFFCFLLVWTGIAVAQTPSPTVPPLIGLSVPEAAAQLNRAGFRLGEVGMVQWRSGAETLVNTVASQSIESGSAADAGTAVDVVVWRVDKAVLIYDDNDITLRNPGTATLPLRRVVFRSVDGNAPAEFEAVSWANRLRGGECMQLWSVERVGGKSVDGCASIEKWLSLTVPQAHFWTGANRATAFEILQDGVRRGTCAVDEQTCEFYLAPSETRGGVGEDIAEYVYLRYTPDWLQLYNRAANRWLTTQEILIGSVEVGDTAQYTTLMDVANPLLLAPGQCLTWGNQSGQQTASCDTVAEASVESPFWTMPFNVDSRVNGAPHACPAAEAGKTAVCLVPRLESPE
jgi:hypothetical protein